MVGLVIATHGKLGEELLNAVEMIIGPVRNARSIAVSRESSLEDIRREMQDAIQAAGTENQGVIIMTDMFGGTPANVGLTFLEPDKIEVLTGINLPMVLKFFNSQEGIALDELAGILKTYGQQSISLASEYLRR
ncbi:MAG TPA: PTS sugar transporter subunit IIA [Desulfuromonadales bacterium]|nr:PTS sugar transporter subunit IIA [Desulfuromonadales bacterium]